MPEADDVAELERHAAAAGDAREVQERPVRAEGVDEDVAVRIFLDLGVPTADERVVREAQLAIVVASQRPARRLAAKGHARPGGGTVQEEEMGAAGRRRRVRHRLGACAIEDDGALVAAPDGAPFSLEVAEVADRDAGGEETLRHDEELDHRPGRAAAMERTDEAALLQFLDVLERGLAGHAERIRDLLRVARAREEVEKSEALDVGEGVEVLCEAFERVKRRAGLGGRRRHGVVGHRKERLRRELFANTLDPGPRTTHMMPSPSKRPPLPITPDRITRLREFGLSEYAARSYLALLDLGTTEARDVSSLSKVPASKIYHILEQLHEKGLVVVLPEFPRKYAPVPFHDFLQRIHDEHQSAAQAVARDRHELEAAFAVVGDVAGGDRGSVTLLRGRRNVLERVAEALDGAREDALVLLSTGQTEDARGWREIAEAAMARGVRVRLLGAGPAAEMRPRPTTLPPATFALVVDGRRAFLGHALPDDGHPSEGNDTGLLVEQEGLVALLAALLEAQWSAAPAPGRPLAVQAEGRRGPTATPQP